MNYPMDLHLQDLRPISDQQEDLISLNIIQDVLEETIGSYAIQNPENLYDQEYSQIVRILEFSRGVRTHQIVITPDGSFRWISSGFASHLLMEIHNALLGVEVFDHSNLINSDSEST